MAAASRDECAHAQGKLIVVAWAEPWTGLVYTTKGSSRHVYRDPAELLALIGVLSGWPPGAVLGASTKSVPSRWNTYQDSLTDRRSDASQ